MVPGARRDAHVRNIVPRGDRGNQRLRTVAAGHADHVGAPGDSVLGQLEQVIAWAQDDGLDAPLPAFLGEVEPLHLAAPGLRIHDQNGVRRAPGLDELRRSGVQLPAGPHERIPRGQHRHAAQDHDEDQPPDADVGEEQADYEPREEATTTATAITRTTPRLDTAYQAPVAHTSKAIKARTTEATWVAMPMSRRTAAASLRHQGHRRRQPPPHARPPPRLHCCVLPRQVILLTRIAAFVWPGC